MSSSLIADDYLSLLLFLVERLNAAGRVLSCEAGKLYNSDLFACSAFPFKIAGRFSKIECRDMLGEVLCKAFAGEYPVKVHTRSHRDLFQCAANQEECSVFIQRVALSSTGSQTVEDDLLLQDWTPMPISVLPPHFEVANLFATDWLPSQVARTRSLHLAGRYRFQLWRYDGVLQFRAQLGDNQLIIFCRFDSSLLVRFRKATYWSDLEGLHSEVLGDCWMITVILGDLYSITAGVMCASGSLRGSFSMSERCLVAADLNSDAYNALIGF